MDALIVNAAREVRRQNSAREGFCCAAAGFTAKQIEAVENGFDQALEMTEDKPVKVGGRSQDVLWKASTENLWKYNHRQRDTSRDTSRVDDGQFAPGEFYPSRWCNLAGNSPGPARIKVRQRRVDLQASTVLKPVSRRKQKASWRGLKSGFFSPAELT